MTITVEKESKTMKQKTIEVPAYYSFGLCYYKILNGSDYIEIAADDEVGIKMRSFKNIVGMVACDGEVITAETFDEAYSVALEKLRSYQPEPVSV